MSAVAGFDVFLSYARSEGAPAQQLDDWLKSRGLRTFIDRRELVVGLPWVPALEDAIGRSSAVAILIGRHGIGNTQQYERELAVVRQTQEPGFPVIPVLLPGCDNPPTGFLQLVTWVDLRGGASPLDQPGALQSLLSAIRRLPVDSAAIRGSICPYMGLEAFQEEDAAFFCGRAGAIGELLEKVRDHNIVVVVGRSGSGKSSLVNAGLAPALRRQWRNGIWDVVTLKPGASPLLALAGAFNDKSADGGAIGKVAQLESAAAALRDGQPDLLARVVDERLRLATEKPDRLLIHVDQWEELYAQGPPAGKEETRPRHDSDVARFIDLLLAAATDPAAKTRIVLTVRADFYGHLIRHPTLASLLPVQQINLGPMTRADLKTAITAPAETVGLKFSPPELVDRILDDAGEDERLLPLLQYALKETWVRREGAALTAVGYTASGGVRGAIRTTADRTYAALTPAEQEATRRLFLRLVTPGEGQEDTRARAMMPPEPTLQAVVQKFTDRRARLLVTGAEPVPGGGVRATVEVAHEALIQTWPTLREWLDASRSKLRARAAIMQELREWESHDRRDDLLLSAGYQLERGRNLLLDPGDVPVDDLRDYVRLSAAREEDRIAKELETTRNQAIQQDRNRRMRAIAAIMAILTVSASGAGVYALRQATLAESRAKTIVELNQENTTLAKLLRQEYNAKFKTVSLPIDKSSVISADVDKLKSGMERYRAVSQKFDMPWYFLGIIHGLESGYNFNVHLHNGDPLTARTVHVPKGRPVDGDPPFTWESSAADFITVHNYNSWHDWSIAGMLILWEINNGLGYRIHHGINSPYVWGCTNYYTKGRYVADGHFDPEAVDDRCGGAAILKRLADEGIAQIE